jgi:hypothetical protein
MQRLIQFWDQASPRKRMVVAITTVVVAVLVAVGGIVAVLSNQDNNISVRDASITNMTDSAFTLVWVSDTPYIGRVVYQEGDGSNWGALFSQAGKAVAYDDRDVELDAGGNYVQVAGGAKARYSHHVTVRNLKPETKYTFRVAGAINGKATQYNFTTTRKLIEDINTPDPAYGLVEIDRDNADKDLVIVANVLDKDYGAVSTWLSETKTYSIDLNAFSTKPAKNDILNAKVVGKSLNFFAELGLINYKPLETITVSERKVAAYNAQQSVLGAAVSSVKAASCSNGRAVPACDCGSGTACVADWDAFVGLGGNCGKGREAGVVQCENAAPEPVTVPNTVIIDSQETSVGEVVTSYSVAAYKTEGAACEYGGPATPDQNRPFQGGCDGGGPLQCLSCGAGGGEGRCGLSSAICDAGLTPNFTVQTTTPEVNFVPYPAETAVAPEAEESVTVYRIDNNCDGQDKKVTEVGTGDFRIKDECERARAENGTGTSGEVLNSYYRCSLSGRVETTQIPVSAYESVYRAQGWLTSPSKCDVVVAIAPATASVADTEVVRGDFIQLGEGRCQRFTGTLEQQQAISSGSGSVVGSCTYYLGSNEDNLSCSTSKGTTISTHSDLGECQDAARSYCQARSKSWNGSSCISPEPTGPTSLVPSVSAQQTPASKGAVLGASTDGVDATESGRYAFFRDGNRIAEQDVVVENGQVTIKLFEDANGNGQKDGAEAFVSDYSKITVAKEASVETFNLSAGWNLINVPMVDTRDAGTVRTAEDLLDYWNAQAAGADITHVARFRNGQFQIFSKRESGNSYAPDFDLIPGEALFVLNRGDNAQVTFSGNKFPEGVELTLANGWNLVGIMQPESAGAINSEAVLRKMSEQGINGEIISQFENGNYQSVISKDDTIFGNNFNVVQKRGYFIKVADGGGKKFKP